MKYNEIKRLVKISDDSWYAKGCNGYTTAYSYKIFKKNSVIGSVLELGPAEGVMTDKIIKDFKDVTIVEASNRFCKFLSKKYKDIKVYNCLFENFRSKKKYSNIILGHVLEHVINPHGLLKNLKKNLLPGGVIFCAVPNARSLHRQAAVILNLLKNEYQLNISDKHHGHRRVYNPETLRNEFLESGYEIINFGGYWIKTLSNKQVEKSHSLKMVEAFMFLGERYPDIAAEIYVVAKNK
jgi:SAM-dependent methyltransferase